MESAKNFPCGEGGASTQNPVSECNRDLSPIEAITYQLEARSRANMAHLRGMRLFVLGRINGLPDNVVVDLFWRLRLSWLGWGYHRRWRRFRLRRCRHRRN